MKNDELSQKNSPSSYVRFLIKVEIDLHEFVSVQYNSNTFNIQMLAAVPAAVASYDK